MQALKAKVRGIAFVAPTVVGLLSLAIGIIFRQAFAVISQSIYRQFTAAPMTGTVAMISGMLGFVGLVMLAFYAGSLYRRWRAPGLFLDRKAIESEFKGDPLKGVATAQCCLLLGRKFLERDDFSKIKKLLLPDPDSESVKYLNTTLIPSPNLSEDIRQVIVSAKKKNIAVKLSPQFAGTSWWIGDRDGADPFIHIELVMPHLARPNRPSFRVYKTQDLAFYNRHCDAFDQLWDNARSV
jgi:hypothetical protein